MPYALCLVPCAYYIEVPHGQTPKILPTHLLTGAIFLVGSENLHHKFGILKG